MIKMSILATLLVLGLVHSQTVIPSNDLRTINIVGIDPSRIGGFRANLQNRFRPNPNPYNVNRLYVHI